MTLNQAQESTQYTIRELCTQDDELNAFRFSLGCYSGEPITVVSRRKSTCVVALKDSRYCIDRQLADAIIV